MKIDKQSAHAVIYPFEDTRLHYDNEGGAYIYNYDGSLVLCIYEAEYGEDFWWTVFDANTYTVLDNMRFGLAGQSTLEKAIQNFLKKSIYADEFDIQQKAAKKIYKALSTKIADANEIEMVVDGKYCDGYAYVTTNDDGVTLDVEVDVECWGDNGEDVVNSFFSLSGKNSAQNLAIELGFYVESEYGDELGIDFDHLEQQFKDYFKTGSKSAFNKNAMGRKSKDQVEREMEDAGYRFCAYEYDYDAQSRVKSFEEQGYEAKLLRERSDTPGLKMFSVWVKGHPRYTNKYSSTKNATRHFTYAEMQELDDEIEGRELHNSSRLRYTTDCELM